MFWLRDLFFFFVALFLLSFFFLVDQEDADDGFWDRPRETWRWKAQNLVILKPMFVISREAQKSMQKSKQAWWVFSSRKKNG